MNSLNPTMRISQQIIDVIQEHDGKSSKAALKQRILELLLYRTLQRPRPVYRVEPDLYQLVHESIADLELELALRQTRPQPGELYRRDTTDLRLQQRVEHHRLVDTVDKLRTEMLGNHAHHCRFHRVVVFITGQLLDQV